MNNKVKIVGLGLLAMTAFSCGTKHSTVKVAKHDKILEDYRPTYHFTPKSGWMNDPNGLVYLDGEYHLFFQHNPDSNVWGPMHWGHAISTDLVNWVEQPIALFPDSLGTIFSGSAVLDKDNTAGFGSNALIAIYTNHSHDIENKKTGLHQTQSIAYSLDKGKTWTKYKGNPVLPNPGIWDFRDPKVSWHAESKQWIMTLATKQSITFYGSKNLKEWTRLSEFGENIGAHGGVWECPDLFRFKTPQGEKWVLLVSINPGGPNTGSATQYFVGNFDGKGFKQDDEKTRWMDYGPDNYAGVTFSNTGDRKLLIGWMSNWLYANDVPTTPWRSATTIVRELDLINIDNNWILTSKPAREFDKLSKVKSSSKSIALTSESSATFDISSFKNMFDVAGDLENGASFSIELKNQSGDVLTFGFDKAKNQYFIDRSKAGSVDFKDSFVKKAYAPRINQGDNNFRFVIDRGSIELFANDGATNMSAVFFTKDPFTSMEIKSDSSNVIKNIEIKSMF